MKKFWAGLTYVTTVIQGIGTGFLGLFAITLIVLFIAIDGPRPVKVANNTVLVLRPNGALVEQLRYGDPFEEYVQGRSGARDFKTGFHDVMHAIRAATKDPRITGIHLDLTYLAGGGSAHLHEIADALEAFKAADKTIIASASSYSQSGYLLATTADKILLNETGSAFLTGFGSYPLYYAELLKKLGATVNVFRVGTYKSAVEPFELNQMSEAAKEANQTLLNDLWDTYLQRIAKGRSLDPATVQAAIDTMPSGLRESGGSFAEFALQQKWVDTLYQAQEWKSVLAQEFGDGGTYQKIDYSDYLRALPTDQGRGEEIAVITVQGVITLGGSEDQVANALTIVEDIITAREHSETGAILLRIDSPGGSEYAGHLIRQEVLAAQQDGIKVIASMGPAAASGGYQIAASADEIWASSTTITGSIGIFAVIPTWEETLSKVGVFADGVGTTKLAGGFDIRRGLNDEVKTIAQVNIERGYQDFLALVADGRGKTTTEIDGVAQGRPWSGNAALRHGLVDHLGGFYAAADAAARSIGAEGAPNIVFYEAAPSPLDMFLGGLLNAKALQAAMPQKPNYLGMEAQIRHIVKDLGIAVQAFDDPYHSYTLCFTCEVY